MQHFSRIFCLGLAILATVSGYPSEPEPEPPSATEAEGVTAIGEAFSATAPTPTKKKLKSTNGLAVDRARLRKDLFRDYDKKINPDNLTVKFGLALIDIDIDEARSTVESGLWQRIVWTDSRLAWDEADYGGVSILRLEPDEVWRPDVTLYNSADHPSMIECWKSNVLIYPTGEVLWVPPCHSSSMCDLHLEEFPYGEQNCTLKFGSWTLDGFTMDLQFYNGEERVDMSDFWKSPKWEVVSNTAKRTEKYYDCCAEPYPDLTYTLTLKRRSDLITPAKVETGHKS